jgi:polyhydroxyalkanoate synthesis regulator phasin
VRFVRLKFERCHDRGENDENRHDELVDELLAQYLRQAKYESKYSKRKIQHIDDNERLCRTNTHLLLRKQIYGLENVVRRYDWMLLIADSRVLFETKRPS